MIKIHRILHGPEFDHDLEAWFLIVDTEKEGDMYEMSMYFDTEDDSMKMVNHFKTSIEPLTLSPEGGDQYDV